MGTGRVLSRAREASEQQGAAGRASQMSRARVASIGRASGPALAFCLQEKMEKLGEEEAAKEAINSFHLAAIACSAWPRSRVASNSLRLWLWLKLSGALCDSADPSECAH